MNTFLQRVAQTTYASKAVAALPAANNRPPRITDFITSYFVATGRPAPRMTDGITEGFIHYGSRVEVLFVEMTHTDWCLLAVWVNENFADHITNSHSIRCYADRVDPDGIPFRQRIRGRKYLTLISSPYETKQNVREHVQAVWRVHVEVLYINPTKQHVAEGKRQHPLDLLSKPIIPQPLTRPEFKYFQGDK